MMRRKAQQIIDRLVKRRSGHARRLPTTASSIDAVQLEERILFSAAPVPTEPLLDAAADDLLTATDDASVNVAAPANEHVAHASSTATARRELVFIDAAAENYQQLVDDLLNNHVADRDIEVVLLDGSQDGIEHITDTLSGYNDLDAIHIVSHGTDGAVKLGNTWLDINNLEGFADNIATWNHAVRDGADLLLYGCDLASDEDGQALAEALSALCGCDVAASVDDTGHAALGGDWDLEVNVGVVETETIFSPDLQENWDALLNTFVVSNTNNSGAGSLRQAIMDANALAGLDTIDFNISAPLIGGVHTIALATALPTITDAVIIDGTSEPDFAGTPIIELDGSGTGFNVDGLELGVGSDGSTIRALVINGFDDAGIHIHDADGNTIEGNYLGTDVTGTFDPGFMDNGINLVNSDNNVIGGDTAAARNVISGNNLAGLAIRNGSSGNVVKGNYIGTTFDGTAARSNFNGVYIQNSSNNTIGGTTAGSRNIISGNTDEGVEIQGSTSSGNTVLGNYIGTDVTGTVAIANAGDGVLIEDAPSNTIGGTAVGAGNLISGNAGSGIHIAGSNAGLNSIQGNYIGTNWDGITDIANQVDGVRIDDSAEGASTGAAGNLIGGATPGARNVISGNDGSGIVFSGFGTDFNRVQGNYIGTNAAGTAAVQNDKWGIIIVFDADNNVVGTDGDGTDDATEGNLISGNNWEGISIQTADFTTVAGNYIGTDAAGTGAIGNSSGVWITGGSDNNLVGTDGDGTSDVLERNVISGNDSRGVRVSGVATLNTVAGNYIGLDALGTGALGNNGHGIRMNSSVGGNTIGGISANLGNTIAYNSGDGVVVANGTGNRIRMNEIYANGGLGIDLSGGTEDVFGVTSNDALDADPGPNNLQNFAVLTAATISGSDLTVSGSLASTPGVAFNFDFFASATPDPSSHGEAERYIGSALGISTDGFGNLTLNESLFGAGVSAGEFITATATDQFGNTSEFALNIVATSSNNPPTATDNTNAITEDAVAPVGGNVIIDDDGFGVDSDPDLDPINVTQINAVIDPAIDVTGSYGTLDWASNGDYSYTVDNGNAAVQALDAGETLTDTFTYTIDDGNSGSDTATLTITINGAEDSSVVGGTTTGSVTEDGTLVAGGTLTITDVDTSDNPLFWPDAGPTLGDNGYGDFQITSNNWTYTLNNTHAAVQALDAGEMMLDTHTFIASDGSTQSVTITINGAEDASVVGGTTTGSVTEDGTLVASGTLTITEVDTSDNPIFWPDAGPTLGDNGYGDFQITSNNWTYTLNNSHAAVQSLDFGEMMLDTHTFIASDGSTQAVTITINGAEDAPVIGGTSIGIVTEDGTLIVGGTLTITDVDTSDNPIYWPDAGPTLGDNGYGDFEITSNDWTYTLNNAHAAVQALDVGEPLSDTHTFIASDGSTQVVTITINGTEDSPVATDNTSAIDADAVTPVSGNVIGDDDGFGVDSDTDTSDTLSVSQVDAETDPAIDVIRLYGALDWAADGSYSYTVDTGNAAVVALGAGDSLTDTFTYTVSDGTTTDTATLTITINGTNNTPVATANTNAINEDALLPVSGNVIADDDGFGVDSDPDSDPLSVNQVNGISDPAIDVIGLYGTLDWDGAGSYSYSVDNGNAAVQTLAVGETLTDTFTYTLYDGTATDTATLTITITGTNDDPITTANTNTIAEDALAPVGGNVLTDDNGFGVDSDTDANDTLSVSQIDGETNPLNNVTGSYGTLDWDTNGSYSYSVDNGNAAVQALAIGETLIDTFTYTLYDGTSTDTATLTVTITGTNDDPVATANANTIAEDAVAPVGGNVITDDDGFGGDSETDSNDVLSVSQIDGETNPLIDVIGLYGTLDWNASGDYSYTVDNGNSAVQTLAVGEMLTDTFTYTLYDGTGTDTAALTITINGANDNPTAVDDTGLTDEDSVLNVVPTGVLANDNDADTSDSPTVTEVNGSAANAGTPIVLASGATLTLNANGSYDYDPNGAFEYLAVGETTTDTFTYKMSDGSGGSDTATVTITIDGRNDGPTANDDFGGGFNTDEDNSFVTANVLGNDSDPDAKDVLSVVGLNTGGTLGTVTDNGSGTFTYDPAGAFDYLAAGATATDTFSYTVDDGNGSADTATVTIRIDGINDAPVANFDPAGVIEGGTVNIDLAGNDADADDGIDPASISIVSGPSKGMLVINTDGTVDYTHNGSETTTDGFTYRIRDLAGTNSNVAAVDIVVNPLNDPPVAGDDSYSTKNDTTLTVNMTDGVQDNDNDAENDPLHTTVVAGPSNGAVVLNTDGSFTYTPDAGFLGTDSFTYTANDGTIDSNDATVTIEVKLNTLPPTVDVDPDPEPEEEEDPAPDLTLPPSDLPVEDPPPSITPPSDRPPDTRTDDGAPRIVLVDETEQEDIGLSNLLRDFGRPDIRDLRYLTKPPQLLKTFTEFSEGISLDGAYEFFEQLDSLEDLLNSQTVIANVTAGSAGVISLGLSAGYAFVTIRAGTLVTSLLTSMPAWRVVDPLPVLAYLNDEDDDDLDAAEKNETLESIVAGAGLEA